MCQCCGTVSGLFIILITWVYSGTLLFCNDLANLCLPLTRTANMWGWRNRSLFVLVKKWGLLKVFDMKRNKLTEWLQLSRKLANESRNNEKENARTYQQWISLYKDEVNSQISETWPWRMQTRRIIQNTRSSSFWTKEAEWNYSFF